MRIEHEPCQSTNEDSCVAIACPETGYGFAPDPGRRSCFRSALRFGNRVFQKSNTEIRWRGGSKRAGDSGSGSVSESTGSGQGRGQTQAGGEAVYRFRAMRFALCATSGSGSVSESVSRLPRPGEKGRTAAKGRFGGLTTPHSPSERSGDPDRMSGLPTPYLISSPADPPSFRSTPGLHRRPPTILKEGGISRCRRSRRRRSRPAGPGHRNLRNSAG